METSVKTREELQDFYELAFFPLRIHGLWMKIKRGEIEREAAIELIRGALLLHRALPESGFASHRALKRLAQYQAESKPFAPVTFLTKLAKRLGEKIEPSSDPVPPSMVRDIALPQFCRPRPIPEKGES